MENNAIGDNSRNSQQSDCSFVWDETSQLYFHASTGFYYDPVAGWYYNSRDGLYYKFENGSYVLIKAPYCGNYHSEETVPENPIKEDESCSQENHSYSDDPSLLMGGESEANIHRGGDRNGLPLSELVSKNEPENLPPSEWLEDTLIDLYLSGYSNSRNFVTGEETLPLDSEDRNNLISSTDGAEHSGAQDLEEGEWVPEENHVIISSTGNISTEEEEASWDEENWRSQYGQVIQTEQEPVQSAIDIWDWATVMGPKRVGKGNEMRLTGRLVRSSAKLHPSMPSGGRLFKTAPVIEVHLDLVRVKTGKLYKLRRPSARYLASVAAFDSSNPTKDWGFPELSVKMEVLGLSYSGNNRTKPDTAPNECSSAKLTGREYRDRAAERRILHGSFGVGPGQNKSVISESDMPSSPISECPEDSLAEALNRSFGSGSYARRMLENMGWKEGEGLGSSTKGMVEPIQAAGNIGNAGLGWSQGRRKHT